MTYLNTLSPHLSGKTEEKQDMLLGMLTGRPILDMGTVPL